MATLLFKLNNVPEDEAAEVRELLQQQGFHTYETSAGFFGLGVAAIWLVNASDKPLAMEAIDAYQAERAIRMRAEYDARVARGEEPTLWDNIKASPLRFVGLLILLCFILSIMLLPFWYLI